MDDTNEDVVDLTAYHCYKLRHHESYFNWIDDQFDVAKAQERISSSQCPKSCLDIGECEFCCLGGEWRQHVEPFPFLNGNINDQISKDKGHFHDFVSANSEMAFLEAFTGDFDKAKNRLDYLNLVIDCVGEELQHWDYLDGYKYISATLGAFTQFCESTLSHSDVASLPRFKGLTPQAQIGVISLKFLFCKEIKDSVKIQIPILRKLIELDPTNAVWHESLGLRLRVMTNESLRLGRKFENCSVEQTTAFATAYNLRPDVPRFFASFSRNVAETLKVNRHQSLAQPIKIDVLNQSYETIEGVLKFMKSHTRLLLDAVDDIDAKNDTANALSSMCEVFSVSLPSPFYDLKLAEECVTAAVRICPTSSKSNHRMGLFQFLKRRNFETALMYLTEAVGAKMENFYAVVDWIQLLIHKWQSKYNLLVEIFEHIFAADFKWSAAQIARLIFLNGCFNFVVNGAKAKTMDLWIRAYENDGMTQHFSVAFNEARRFQWKSFDVKEILQFLTDSKLKSTPTVRKIISEIRDRGATSKRMKQFHKAKSEQK